MTKDEKYTIIEVKTLLRIAEKNISHSKAIAKKRIKEALAMLCEMETGS